MNRHDLLEKAIGMCENKGHKLIYLTEFGSHLYGTNGPNSDTDIKGIFLPSKTDLLLAKKCDHITFNTGSSKGKNTSDDIDLQLWSLHHWLNLVQIGDTNALDLLYSWSSRTAPIFSSSSFTPIFNLHDKLYDKHKLHGYIGYVLGQAKKYGIKGSRLGVIKRVKEWIDSSNSKIYFDKLSHWIETILKECGEPSYCFEKEVNNVSSILICGKVHQGTISMTEFAERINRDYERYGERARLAELDNGIDWKAISHAFRAIVQMKQILMEGKIVFPLKNADYLRKIKQGKISWKNCEDNLLVSLEELKELQDKTPSVPADVKLIQSFILGMYV